VYKNGAIMGLTLYIMVGLY